MTAREAKELLRDIRREDEYILDLAAQCDELRARAEGAGSSLGGSGGGRDEDDKTARYIARLIECEQTVRRKVEEHTAKKAAAITAICEMESADEKRVLLLYYFPRHISEPGRGVWRTWDDVAAEMHVDVRTAQNYHGRALQSFSELLKP